MGLTTTQVTLAPEITGLTIPTNQFKTNRISISFVLPLDNHLASTASILSRLLTRSTGRYPTPVALQRQLLAMYGARFSSQILKLADAQLLNISITILDDRFALEGEQLCTQAADFLCDALFEPNLKDQGFLPEDLELCRRLLIESLESTVNDKRRYAINKMYGIMCKDEPFGVEIGGTIQSAKAVTGEDVYHFWQSMLRSAPVVVSVVGNMDADQVYHTITRRFEQQNRAPKPVHPTFCYHKPEAVQTVTETMALAQGKLVMGLRSSLSSMEQDNLPLRIMCDIFGGSPYSKLFTVVREKMSLCYYCAARLQSQKGIICVDSGVDNQNILAAQQGIMDQLAAMQAGDFSADDMEASFMSMADSARSVTDSAEAMESWYLARLFDHELVSPDEFIARLNGVTKESIVKAANTVTLDTVYILKGQEEAQ